MLTPAAQDATREYRALIQTVQRLGYSEQDAQSVTAFVKSMKQVLAKTDDKLSAIRTEYQDLKRVVRCARLSDDPAFTHGRSFDKTKHPMSTVTIVNDRKGKGGQLYEEALREDAAVDTFVQTMEQKTPAPETDEALRACLQSAGNGGGIAVRLLESNVELSRITTEKKREQAISQEQQEKEITEKRPEITSTISRWDLWKMDSIRIPESVNYYV